MERIYRKDAAGEVFLCVLRASAMSERRLPAFLQLAGEFVVRFDRHGEACHRLARQRDRHRDVILNIRPTEHARKPIAERLNMQDRLGVAVDNPKLIVMRVNFALNIQPDALLFKRHADRRIRMFF